MTLLCSYTVIVAELSDFCNHMSDWNRKLLISLLHDFLHAIMSCGFSEIIAPRKYAACFRMMSNFVTLVMYSVQLRFACGSDCKFCCGMH